MLWIPGFLLANWVLTDGVTTGGELQRRKPADDRALSVPILRKCYDSWIMTDMSMESGPDSISGLESHVAEDAEITPLMS